MTLVTVIVPSNRKLAQKQTNKKTQVMENNLE